MKPKPPHIYAYSIARGICDPPEGEIAKPLNRDASGDSEDCEDDERRQVEQDDQSEEKRRTEDTHRHVIAINVRPAGMLGLLGSRQLVSPQDRAGSRVYMEHH